MTTPAEPTVEELTRDLEQVTERLNLKAEALGRNRLRRCLCPCDCGIMHLRGDVCCLCRDGDHWHGLDRYLKQIEARVQARRENLVEAWDQGEKEYRRLFRNKS